MDGETPLSSPLIRYNLADFLEAQTIHYQLAGWLETREEHSWRYGEKEDQARHVSVGLPSGASLERK